MVYKMNMNHNKFLFYLYIIFLHVLQCNVVLSIVPLYDIRKTENKENSSVKQ